MSDRSTPLAVDKFGRPIELPDNADGFAVLRVPSGRGGAPRAVMADGYPLEIELSTTPERLWELLGQPGRYRLDVVDADANPIRRPSGAPIQCWWSLKAPEGSGPQPQSTVEVVQLEMARQLNQALQTVADSNRELASALARRESGAIRRPLLGAPSIGADDDLDSVRERLEALIASSQPEQPESAEDQLKKAQAAKVWVETIFNTLAEHGPKAWGAIQMIKAALTANAPAAPKLPGTP